MIKSHFQKFPNSFFENSIGTEGCEIRVQDGNKRIGRLRVKNNGIEWVPTNKKKGFKVGWKKLEKILNDESM